MASLASEATSRDDAPLRPCSPRRRRRAGACCLHAAGPGEAVPDARLPPLAPFVKSKNYAPRRGRAGLETSSRIRQSITMGLSGPRRARESDRRRRAAARNCPEPSRVIESLGALERPRRQLASTSPSWRCVRKRCGSARSKISSVARRGRLWRTADTAAPQATRPRRVRASGSPVLPIRAHPIKVPRRVRAGTAAGTAP